MATALVHTFASRALSRRQADLPSTNSSRNQQRGWSHFPHGADIGVCGWGPTIETAFEEAAKALMAAVTIAPVRPMCHVPVEGHAQSLELLFVTWLNTLIYEMAVHGMVFGQFDLKVVNLAFTGKIGGELIEKVRHQPACEPKGATFTELKVTHDAQGWRAQCVVDV